MDVSEEELDVLRTIYAQTGQALAATDRDSLLQGVDLFIDHQHLSGVIRRLEYAGWVQVFPVDGGIALTLAGVERVQTSVSHQRSGLPTVIHSQEEAIELVDHLVATLRQEHDQQVIELLKEIRGHLELISDGKPKWASGLVKQILGTLAANMLTSYGVHLEPLAAWVAGKIE